MVKRLINAQSGFSILEVMVALAIFGAYATVMILTQVSNTDRSMNMAKDLKLHTLAQMKMNEVLIRKNEFTNASENDVETGNIEIEGLEYFKFQVEFKRNEFPDFSALMGQTDEQVAEADPNAGIKKLIFDKMKKNVEEMIWQVKVTIINTQDSTSYELNSWVNKDNAKLDTKFSF